MCTVHQHTAIADESVWMFVDEDWPASYTSPTPTYRDRRRVCGLSLWSVACGLHTAGETREADEVDGRHADMPTSRSSYSDRIESVVYVGEKSMKRQGLLLFHSLQIKILFETIESERVLARFIRERDPTSTSGKGARP